MLIKIDRDVLRAIMCEHTNLFEAHEMTRTMRDKINTAAQRIVDALDQKPDGDEVEITI